MVNEFTQTYDWPTPGSLIDAINNSGCSEKGIHQFRRWCQALQRACRANGEPKDELFRRVR